MKALREVKGEEEKLQDKDLTISVNGKTVKVTVQDEDAKPSTKQLLMEG